LNLRRRRSTVQSRRRCLTGIARWDESSSSSNRRRPACLPGLLRADVAYRLERAGAVVTRLAEVGATLVDWPLDTLRRFMLEEVLLNELGHHVLQHYKGKRPQRIARTRDHEAFAARFADTQMPQIGELATVVSAQRRGFV